MFSLFSKYPLAKFACLGLLTPLLSHTATAQAYNPVQDPLVQRTINHGEQMRMTLPNSTNIDRGPFFSDASDISIQLVFLSRPPALGEPITVTSSGASYPSIDADLSRESFYSAYATLLPQKSVSKKQAERIATYRAERQSLLQEIRSKLAEFANADGAKRQAALAELATKQEDRLRTLETAAEALRDDCGSTGRPLALALAFRRGFRGFKNPSAKTSFQFFVSAAFDLGLSPEQQRLLTEMAYEEQAEFESPANENADYLAFLPATARIRLPANLPAALTEKIKRFIRDQEKLKSDLRAAVLHDDDFAHLSQRTYRLTKLAEGQVAPFAALEVLSEEIRVGLAAFNQIERPTPPPQSGDLPQRVGDFNARKAEVQRELRKRLRELSAEFPKAKFTIEHRGNALAISQNGASHETINSITKFNATLAKRYLDFAQESEVLRRDIRNYAERRPDTATRTVDQVAADFLKAYATQEKWNHDRDYYNAVLEPGLSPAQRTLLFHAVIADTAQDERASQR